MYTIKKIVTALGKYEIFIIYYNFSVTYIVYSTGGNDERRCYIISRIFRWQYESL